MQVFEDDQVVIMRFWQEDQTTGSATQRHWRARITYVNAGQRLYTSSIDGAFAIVKSLLLSAASAE